MKAILRAVLVTSFAFTSTTAFALEKVKIGILNGASAFISLVADGKGYLKEAGIEADFIIFDSGAKMIPSIATGGLDIGIGAASSALYNAVGRGMGVKIVSLCSGCASGTPPGRASANPSWCAPISLSPAK